MRFAVYNRDHGWLVDTGVGGTYSFDVTQAQWFEPMPNETIEETVIGTLIATDILDPRDRWRVIQGLPFVIVRVR